MAARANPQEVVLRITPDNRWIGALSVVVMPWDTIINGKPLVNLHSENLFKDILKKLSEAGYMPEQVNLTREHGKRFCVVTLTFGMSSAVKDWVANYKVEGILIVRITSTEGIVIVEEEDPTTQPGPAMTRTRLHVGAINGTHTFEVWTIT